MDVLSITALVISICTLIDHLHIRRFKIASCIDSDCRKEKVNSNECIVDSTLGSKDSKSSLS